MVLSCFHNMHILQTGYGVGDVLMATGVLRAWRRVHHGEKLFVSSRFPELFSHNPDIVSAFLEHTYQRMFKQLNKPVLWRLGNAIDTKLIKPTYPFPSQGKHIMDGMAETIGLRLLPEEHRPFLYLSHAEKEAETWAEQYVAVQSSSTTYWTPNKSWVPGRMQTTVNELVALGYKAAQLGVVEDEPLQGAVDLRGKTSLRQGAAILANAKLFIGLEGGLVHMARAVGTRSVVIYTGYTTPEETGYPENANLRASLAGISCWSRVFCEHCRESAEAVHVDDVINEIRFLLENRADLQKNYVS
jgi:ADP-heptose:LPS heptosyltransferase